ncbi:MAG: hypothetical protein HRU22_00605 [Gammaproteobacteria bacterium]|nr:hypothetical protein [Gammaproteobacteria bacterium]
MRPFVFLLLTLMLSACAKPPAQVILSPTMIQPTIIQKNQGSFDLQVVDNRNYRHILQMNNGATQQSLVNANQQPTQLVSEALKQSFSHQGYDFSPTATVVMTVEIEQMLITLNQQSIKYDANNNIVLNIIIGNNNKTLTKKFNISGQSYGPFSADVAVLERIFNQQLGELISKIAADDEVHQFLKVQ